MKGKAAVVTGGARGIGFAVARRFLAEGAAVAILDLRDDAAEHLRLAGRKNRARFLSVKADVTLLAEVEAAGARIASEFGRLDIWVNNAGWDRVRPFLSTGPEDWAKILAVNLLGVIHGTRVAAAAMVRQGAGGAIVNIGSDAGRVGSAGEAVYSAAKGGVIAFTKAMARELASHRIRVNCVCPGPTETPLLAETLGAADGGRLLETLKARIPFQRLADPDEIASAVRFLASDEASYITGQVLSVNGGLHMVG